MGRAMITPRLQLRLQAVLVGMLFTGSLVAVGCDPPLDPKEYGEILDELPKVEGADKPYPLPKLVDPAEKQPPAIGPQVPSGTQPPAEPE